MDSELERLYKRMEEFRRTHIKMIIPGRRELIKQLYEDFLLMFEDCTATIDERDKEIDITLFVPNIITCKQGGYCFNQLIYIAEITDMNISEGYIVIKLNFHLLEWIDK